MHHASNSNHREARVLELGELVPPAHHIQNDLRLYLHLNSQRTRKHFKLPSIASPCANSPEGRLVSREVERVEAEVSRGTAISEHGALNTRNGVTFSGFL